MAGPFNRLIRFTAPPTSWGYRAIMYEKQTIWNTSPHGLRHRPPLSFSMDCRQVTLDTNFPSNGVSEAPGMQSQYIDLAYNNAYKKFVDKLGDQSQWGVNLAEQESALSMIVKRATQLRNFTKKLRRGDLRGAGRELGIAKPTSTRKTAKNFSNLWLEYHFGWEPLVKDIGAAVETLQSPYPLCIIRGKGSHQFNFSETNRSYVLGYGFADQEVQTTTLDIRTHVLIQAWVRVDNPNLYLANQLGFVNPLSIAWELVPYSFVVDWFGNVGQVLASFTDFAGVSFVDPFWTSYQVGNRAYQASFGPTSSYSATKATGAYVRRHIGVPPGPTLALKPFKGLSVSRGATAISLLLKTLKG